MHYQEPVDDKENVQPAAKLKKLDPSKSEWRMSNSFVRIRAEESRP